MIREGRLLNLTERNRYKVPGFVLRDCYVCHESICTIRYTGTDAMGQDCIVRTCISCKAQETIIHTNLVWKRLAGEGNDVAYGELWYKSAVPDSPDPIQAALTEIDDYLNPGSES